jgi:tRNA G10  N-methylase Trm11
MTFGEGDYRSKTVHDPACGTGRLLLHAGNRSLRLFGCDVNNVVLQAMKINGALYCPWLIRPFPETMFNLGDSSDMKA